MDPVTLALQLANKMADIVLLAMQGQPPEVREKLWGIYLTNALWWEKLFTLVGDRIVPPKP